MPFVSSKKAGHAADQSTAYHAKWYGESGQIALVAAATSMCGEVAKTASNESSYKQPGEKPVAPPLDPKHIEVIDLAAAVLQPTADIAGLENQ